MLTIFLILVFALGAVSGLRQFAATARLARWLHEHRQFIWQELDRPGSTFFKGDSDNGYLKRTSALQAMNRLMPLHAYQGKLNDPEALDCLRSHRMWGFLSMLFMLLFMAGILFGVIRDQIRPEELPPGSQIQESEPATRDNRQ